MGKNTHFTSQNTFFPDLIFSNVPKSFISLFSKDSLKGYSGIFHEGSSAVDFDGFVKSRHSGENRSPENYD